MTIEELRYEYENETSNNVPNQRNTWTKVYTNWLETKIVWLKTNMFQSCSECEKHKKAIERLLNYTADDNDIIGNKEVMRKWAYGEDEK